MAEDASKTPSPFDVRTIKYLVGLMSQHDLNEIDLREGDLRIRLRRGSRKIVVSPSAAPVAAASSGAAPPVPAAASETAPALHVIKSPTPGTFYGSPSPDAEPFVRVGTRVIPATVVCIIEAMKIFNEITADCSGIIKEVLVENQQPVEYGQVLLRVDQTG